MFWIQEEKEKFVDIIRNYGKDWMRLYDCLFVKFLIQIKIYFQNLKVKLGFLNLEGLNIFGGRGVGSCKWKVDDFDISSNNVGFLIIGNELKFGFVFLIDVDVVFQKVNLVMVVFLSLVVIMSMGMSLVGIDNFVYLFFGLWMEDLMIVQKFIC